METSRIFRPFTVIREHQHAYPVDVEGLAAEFGVSVVRRDWPNTLSGAIGEDAKGCFIIINSSHPAVRQRFTLAHELAHFLLHRDQVGADGIKDDWKYHSKISEADERAANQLAGEILLPGDLLVQAAAESNLRITPEHLDALAAALGVSATVLAIRLRVPT